MSEDQDPSAIQAPAKPVRRAPARRGKVLPGLPEPLPATIAVGEAASATFEAAMPDPVPDSSPPAAVPADHATGEIPMADNNVADQAHDAVNNATNQAHEAVNTATSQAQDAADRGRALFADWNGRTREAMERGTKAFEQLGDFYKGNLEAFVESSRIAAKGLEGLGQHAAELTRKSFEDATNATKTLSQVKSPAEFMKLQGDYARSTFDTMVAETSRSTEAMLKLAGEVAQPMANRLAVAADRMKTVA